MGAFDDLPEIARQPGQEIQGGQPEIPGVQPIQPEQGEQQQLADSSGAFGDLPDIAGKVLENFVPSAQRFAEDIITAVTSPVETSKALGNVLLGTFQKIIPGEQGSEKHADAVGQFFVDRYGSKDALIKTMSEDPVGFLADVSTVMTGGSTALTRLPGVAGKAAGVVGKVGRAIDPLGAAAKATGATAKVGGRILSELIGGLGTQTGSSSIRIAERAGAAGGGAREAFVGSMRGGTPTDVVVAEARGVVDRMRRNRGIQYKINMLDVKSETRPVAMGPLKSAVAAIDDKFTFKGQSKSPKTEAVRGEIRKIVDDWAALDPSDFHTPEGLDALKQKIGNVRDAQEFGSPARAAAGEVYGAVRSEIIKAAPEYAKVMRGYETASDLITELEKTLTGTSRTPIDQTLRKLQSVLRNNANTAYGRRAELANYLASAGAPDLLNRLAGMSLETFRPRGLGTITAVGALAGGAATGNLPLVASAAASSPRLVGEAALAVGDVRRFAGNATGQLSRVGATPRGIGQSAFQAGRLNRESQ